jgi:hypothetical protein
MLAHRAWGAHARDESVVFSDVVIFDGGAKDPGEIHGRY